MKQVDLYEPALCCSSGVCGTNVDPELIRMKGDILTASKSGIVVKRHNLASDPMAFHQESVVRASLERDGVGVLPLVVVDGTIVLSGRYPTLKELYTFAEVSDALPPDRSPEPTPNTKGSGREGCCS